MEGKAYEPERKKAEAERHSVEQDDTGIRTEFERMMFEFNPEEEAPEGRAGPPRQRGR